MQTITLVLISVLLALLLIVVTRIYFFIRPEELAVGDIVIVRNPHCEKEMMNMITEVINVLSPSCVQLRGIRTTVSMHRKWVRRIDINLGSSIKVPEEPIGVSGHGNHNMARFREVPLKWFSYDAPPKTT